MAKSNTTSLSTPNDQVSLTEHLSAVLDGEAGDFEQRRVLDELGSDDALREKLSSFSLIGEVMRSGAAANVVTGTSFLDGIHEKINSEDEYHQVQLIDAQAKEESHSKSWLRPASGFAMAASVAAIAVIGVQNYQQSSPDVVVASKNDSMVLPKKALTSVADQIQVDDDIAVIASSYRKADNRTRLLLKRYVDSHMKQASMSAFVPSVRVIAYTD